MADFLCLYFGVPGECQMCGGYVPTICPACGEEAEVGEDGLETAHRLDCAWMRDINSEPYEAPRFCADCLPEARTLGWAPG